VTFKVNDVPPKPITSLVSFQTFRIRLIGPSVKNLTARATTGPSGRAVLLGEVVTPAGQRFDVQLKGAGRTAFSRGGDGRAALGPVLREYILGEAMHGLGIPTTRALAAVTTGQPVFRETPLPGAVLTRVAASHLRVGTFQFFASQGDLEGVRGLADYAIERH
jgi:uncharacterized protein YdiU (UPF0061 family)